MSNDSETFGSEEAKMLNLEETDFLLFEKCVKNPIGKVSRKGFEQVLKRGWSTARIRWKEASSYSLRHTYATMELFLIPPALFSLQPTWGTSVEMIESFYGKKRMRHTDVQTEVTKFRDGDHTTK